MIEKNQGTFFCLLLFFYALGIVFAQNFSLSVFDLTIIFVLLFIITVIFFIRKCSKIYLLFFCIFFLIGAIRFTDAISLPKNDISNYTGKNLYISGTVIETPRITEKNEKKRARYTIEANEIEINNERKKVVGNIYFYAPYNGEKVKIGYKIAGHANIKKIRPAGNPGSYDRHIHLLSEGITAEAFGGKSAIKITEGDEHFILRTAAEVREHYKESMEKVMPKEDAAAIFAMLFGGYEGVSEELTEAFTITGIIHILSVSGSHVSMLIAALAWLGGVFRLPLKPLAILVFIVIGFYTLLAGFVPPAVRAAIMGGIVFLGTAIDRDADAKRTLTLVALISLLYNPILLFHISFQLSFTATAGLIYLMPKFTKWLQARGFSYKLSSSFALTISAQILTVPIIAWYFHRLSISSLLANILIVPIVEFVIIIGLLAGIIAFILPFIGRIIFLSDSLILGFVYEITRLFAKLPYSSVYLPTMSVFLSVIYYLLCILIMLEENLREKFIKFFAPYKKGIAIFLIIFSVIGLSFAITRPKEVMFAFIDVGQGDAMLVKTANGRAFMLDTGGTRDGSFDIGARVDVPFLLYHGVTELDYIFLTHVHEDHAAGTGGILKKIPVKAVITAAEGEEAYQRSMKVSREIMNKTKFHNPNKGDIFEIDGVKVEVLHAPKTAMGENEMSNLYRVSYKNTSVLVTGDLVKEDEEKLVKAREDLRATVLKVGHHGSKTSSSPNFLKNINPKFAVISVGADNSFGHPDKEILQNLENTGAKIYRTDNDGAIFFFTDGEKLRVEKYLK